jgi:hypothetical protein
MAPRPAPVAKPAAVGAVSDTDLKNQILKELKKPSKSATCLLPPFASFWRSLYLQITKISSACWRS